MMNPARPSFDPTDLTELYNIVQQSTTSQRKSIYESIDWDAVEAASPDLWHNLATNYAIVDLEKMALSIFQQGSKRWPENIDLLAAMLQYRYMDFPDTEDAVRLWDRMTSTPDKDYYWRYWVYGAVYHAKMLHEPDKALELLTEGLEKVPAKDIANLYRNLPNIVALMPAGPKFTEQLDETILLLKRGIEQAPHEGYTLAIALAKVLQRRASSDTEKARAFLDEAMQAIRIAEMMFDGGDSNHPLSQLLFCKAGLLVAMKSHTEALPLLRAIEAMNNNNHRVDMRSVRDLRLLCEHVLGDFRHETAASTSDQELEPAEVLTQFAALLIEHGPAVLVAVAQQSPQLARHIREAAAMLDE